MAELNEAGRLIAEWRKDIAVLQGKRDGTSDKAEKAACNEAISDIEDIIGRIVAGEFSRRRTASNTGR